MGKGYREFGLSIVLLKGKMSSKGAHMAVAESQVVVSGFLFKGEKQGFRIGNAVFHRGNSEYHFHMPACLSGGDFQDAGSQNDFRSEVHDVHEYLRQQLRIGVYARVGR